ncbi:Uncharacterised protein [uncultured archaeon]|nr:Uncharacterised protein [uncultured archaeon]
MKESKDKEVVISTDPWHPANRKVKTKTGNVKEDHLAPVLVWDSRKQGTYCIGKKQYKRDLKALKLKKNA